MNYYIGWDVGAWHCDRNQKSKDAVCVLTGEWDNLKLESNENNNPWRGNLRKALVAVDGVLAAILEKVGVNPVNEDNVTWAIDTPLGWPAALQELISGNGNTVDVGGHTAENPYLFRQTEQWVGQQGFYCPLSTVKDMIGSQSTKGIHFLHRCGFIRQNVGIWRANRHTAIETYPAPVRTSPLLADRLKKLQNHLWHKDFKDSLWCALVAALFASNRNDLRPPPQNIPPEEGWIWIPTDCDGCHSIQRRSLTNPVKEV